MYKTIPLFLVKENMWTQRVFLTREEYVDYLWSLWKVPGKYEFDSTSFLFNKEAREFQKNSAYCFHAIGSKDFVEYWDTQKERNRNGVIFKNGDKEWFLNRDYYFLLNYLKVYNKEKKNFTFIDVRDAQYHMALYEEIAEHSFKHVAVLKKRQILSSYFHMAKLVNRFWFEAGSINKLAASLGNYIKDDWRFAEEYRDFLNTHTAWYRPCTPDKLLDWQQKIEINQGGKKRDIGLKSVMKGLILDKDPSAGTGGPCHRLGTKILMSSGKYKNVEDIQIGEYVLGVDNIPKQVLRKFSGEDMIYQVDQIRGKSYFTTGDHKLYLINRDKNVSEKSNLRITKTKDWNNLTDYGKKLYVGVKNNNVLHFDNNLPTPTLDPYFLGLWLGDGFREKPGIIINATKDIEILNYIQYLSEKTNTSCSIRRKEENRYKDEMYIATYTTSKDGIDSYFTKQFVKYNLYYNKHIPDEFLYGSPETRALVLAGYIDTDGYYDSDKGRFIVCSKSKELLEQVAFLARSLGAYVTTSTIKSQEHIVRDRIIKYTETNQLTILFTDNSFIPTKIKRKQGSVIRTRNIHTSPIRNITAIGIEPYAGIEVEDNLYYLEDLTITHNCSLFFHDEAGIAPKMNQTIEFLLPALKSGMIYTGMFMAAGSVGDLDDCGPLEDLIKRPHGKDILAVKTDLYDNKGTIAECGLFIPEQWSMPPYVDEYGNSKVEEALEAILAERKQWEKDLTPEDYQLRISQKPISIEEAFATRKESPYPTHLITKQIEKILNNDYYLEYVDVERNINGEIDILTSRKIPISDFPINPKMENKEGVIVMHERPTKSPKFGTYYASLDPVNAGKAEYIKNKVFTPHGRKEIGKLKINDKILDQNGNITIVKNIYPQGKVPLYKVSFSDNTSILVCKEHLWKVYDSTNDKKEGHVLSVNQLLNKTSYILTNGYGKNRNKIYKTSTFYKNKNGSAKWQIPLNKPLKHNKQKLEIHPYLLGALLGDGGLTTDSINFSSNDIEIINTIQELLPSNLKIKETSIANNYRIISTTHKNPLIRQLKKLKIMGKYSYEKFIPTKYLYSTIKDRLMILQGLMDTDGWVDANKNGAYFCSTSKQLAEDVAHIVRSLGGTASINIKKRNKAYDKYHTAYNVRINLEHEMNPFVLSRKKDNYNKINKITKYITNIEYERDDEALCIEVDNQDHLYVSEHCIVTHNTVESNSLACIYIYKNQVELTIVKADGTTETRIEPDKLVCWWTGRFDDLEKTHERIEMLLELYNAWCVVENNVTAFNTYMIKRNKQKYLVPKNQMVFLKEIGANTNVYQDYGWRNTGRLFKDTIMPYGIQFLKEELDHEVKSDGTIVKTYYGIDRIPDIMLLKEMLAWREGLNVDRIIAFSALAAFVKVQNANRGLTKEKKYDDNLQKQNKNVNLKTSPFTNMGGSKYKKTGFKNIR